MSKFKQKAEIIANVLIVIIAVAVIAIIANRYFFNVGATPNQMVKLEPKLGNRLHLENVNFSEQSKTVVLALQTTCRFCNESAAFYKHLLELTKGKNIKFVAVFPTSVEKSIKHLKDLGIDNLEVKQVPLSELETSSTPTLILADSNGEIKRFWVGKLDAQKETEVVDLLNL